MKSFYKHSLVIIMMLISLTTFAQKNFFSDVSESQAKASSGARVIVPVKSRTVTLDETAIKNFLWSLPSEKNVLNRKAAPVLELPMPDGRTAKFNVWESSIQEPALEAKFPNIKTFLGQGIDDPYATIRFDYTPRGFHAQVLTINGTYYIDPYSMNFNGNYISYFRTDLIKNVPFECTVEDAITRPVAQRDIEAACLGTQMRTFRLAVACTGEYAQAPGIAAGTNAATLHAAIVTSVNRVVGVYEREITARMVLVANNNIIEYLNAGTDPFNGNNNANVLINESQTVIDANIGFTNYDIGHTFSTGGGGLAQLNSPCGSSKARGITGSPSPTGDAYDIDYVAHEMGHQFGGNHSMAGCGSSPNSTKYEVGSGTTIQAYAGICAAENIQPNSDPHFHAISFDEISNFFFGGGGCGVITPTNNTLPVIQSLTNSGVTIPIGTPFTLTGTATDADGDALSYCWEQWDFSGTAAWNAGATAAPGNTVPLFKSRLPKTTGSRTFPDIAVINAGYPANPPAAMNGLKGETLSPVAREMKFRLNVRDNRAGGGGIVSAGSGGCQSSTPFVVNVAGTAPFVMTAPNGGESFPGGTTQTVTWNVVGTNAAPFNVVNVKISYSTDGGLTFPTTIMASTANDGTEVVTIPVGATTTARIKVEAIGNIFFDISNSNFTVTVPPNGFEFTATAPLTLSCPAGTPTITIPTTVTGVFSTPIVLTTSGVPAGTTVTFAPSPVTPGISTVATLNNASTLAPGTYTITVTGTAGTVVKTTILTFIVPSSAAITANPTDQAVCTGTSATFTANGTGNGVVFQWQSSLSATGPWASVVGGTGANTNTYTTPLTTPTTPITFYRLNVTTTACAGNANSTAARLVVNTVAAITSQPLPQTVCSPSPASFTNAAVGTGLSYQWQVSTAAVPAFTNITGATNATYTIAATAAADNGNKYRVNIFSTCSPTTPTTSSEVLLTVNTPVTISQNPLVQNGCSGINAQYAVTAAGTGLSYQWQLSTNNGTTFTPILGATTSTYAIPNAAIELNGNLYSVVVTGTCNSLTSTAAKLNLSIKPTIVLTAPATSAVNAAVNQGLFTTISPANFVGTFNWTKNGTAIPNTLASTFILLPVDGVGKYQVSTTDGLTGCVSTSNELEVKTPDNIAAGTLFVYPNPVSGIMQVRFNFPNVGTTGTMLNIYDEKGARIMSIPYTLTSTFGRMAVDMSKVQLGTYMIYLMDASGKKLGSTKVVKVQ
jgi:hypothetical protein